MKIEMPSGVPVFRRADGRWPIRPEVDSDTIVVWKDRRDLPQVLPPVGEPYAKVGDLYHDGWRNEMFDPLNAERTEAMMVEGIEPWYLEPGTLSANADFVEVAKAWRGGHVRVKAESAHSIDEMEAQAMRTLLTVDGPLNEVKQIGNTLELTIGKMLISTDDWYIDDFERIVP